MLAFPFIAFAAVVMSLVQAENDWSVPCTSGTCNFMYDGDGAKQASANLAVSGKEHLLSDITVAAGWVVLDCDPKWEDGIHKIRMVCVGTPKQMALCRHIYEGGSAEHTIVRLPQNCGTGPFARIVSMWEPADQSVPIDIKLQLTAGNFTEPVVVVGVILDYNFHDVPESKGPLAFTLTASNIPHSLPPTKRSMSVAPLRGRKRALQQRGFFRGIGKAIKGAAKDAASVVSHGAADGASAVSHVVKEGVSVASAAAKEAASISSTAVTDVGKDLSAAGSFISSVGVETKDFLTAEHNLTKMSGNIPIQFVKNFTMIDTTISCHDIKENFNAHIKIGVDMNVNTTMSFGIIMAGKLIPPKIEQFHAFSDMEGDADFVIHLGLEAVGTFDSLFVSLFKIGLPGLQIPGFGMIGPGVNVGVRMQMDVNVVSQIDINVAVRMDGIHMAFPPGSGDNSAQAAPKNQTNSLKLSTANAGLDAQGTVNVSFIPRIEFGLDAKFAKALIFLDAELGAVLAMNGDAGVTNTTRNASDATDASTNTTAADATDVSANATTSVAAADSGNATDNSIAAQSDQPNDLVGPVVEDNADVASDAPDNAITTATPNITAVVESTAAAARPTADISQSGNAGASLLTVPAVITRDVGDARDPASGRNKRTVNLARHHARNVIHSKRQDNDSVPDDDTTVGNLVPASSSPGGCITLTSVFSVNAGLQGSIYPLFSKSFNYGIFHTSKQLFQTCFKGVTSKTPNHIALVSAAATAAAVAADAVDTDSTDGDHGSATDGDDTAGGSTHDAFSGSTTSTEDNGAPTHRLLVRASPLRRKDGSLGKRQILPFIGGLGHAGIGGAGSSVLTTMSNIGSTGAPDFNAVESAIIGALVCPSKIAKLNALVPLLGLL